MKPINYPDSYLVVEFTNRCPLACTHCIHSTSEKWEHFNKMGNLDKDLLFKLLDDLARNRMRFQNLITFWLGEPLLHPNFIEIYQAILEHNRRHRTFDQIEVHTNAVPLHENIVDAVLKFGDQKQKWHFTIDAATRETFKRIKGRDEFDRVMKHVEMMVRKRFAAKVSFPAFAFQFIVRNENHHEAPEFLIHFKHLLAELGGEAVTVGGGVPNDGRDYVFFRLFDALDMNEQPKANRLYSKTLISLGLTEKAESPWGEVRRRWHDVLARVRRPVCSGPWKSPVINWDGRVTVCTRDTGFNLQVGDLRENSFSEIWWNNPQLDNMRAAQLAKDGVVAPFCAGCIIPQSANYTGITQEEIEKYKNLSDSN